MKVLVSDPIAREGIQLLEKEAEVTVRTGLKPQELEGIIGDFEALVVRSETQVAASVIEAGRKLVVIGRAGVGVDNIDLEAATRRGIVVLNAPTANTISAAEHTVALMLALARHIPQANSSLKRGEWKRQAFMGVEIRNKRLGLIGLGRVGTEVAKRARGLEMRVIAHDPFVSLDYARHLGVTLVSLEELVKESDFISVHVPFLPGTRGLLGQKELSLMKPGVRLINTSRGGIIDEEALYRAVEEGKVAGAALDVFAQEPPKDSPLLKSDRIIVTPHLGASTAEAQAGVAVDVAEQILQVLKGQPARNAVNMPFVAPEVYAVVAPWLPVASSVGRLAAQLLEGQPSTLAIKYEGEIVNYDTSPLKACVIGGLLESISEERVNIVNAAVIASKRGLKVLEQKDPACENYGSLISLEVTTSAGTTRVSGTLMRGEPHIVHINNYWLDVVPTGGYWLISDHRDRPGLIGAVATILGNVDVNISSMQVARLQPRGQALMVLALDEKVPEEQRQLILALPDVDTAKLVKL